MEKVTVFCFLASYVVALAIELARWLLRLDVLRWGVVGMTGAGLVAQTAYLVVRSSQTDLPPLLGSTHDWLLVSAWLTVVLFLGIQVFNSRLSLGIFFLPVVCLLVILSQFVSTTSMPLVNRSSIPIYWWGMLHATFLVLGMLGVVLALLVSVMYLMQHSRLKHKRSEPGGLHLLSLERLGRLNWWLVIISVPLLTLGILSGLWLSFLANKGAQLVSVAFIADAVIWGAMALLFGWLLVSKHATGRLVAFRTLLACVFLLTTLLAIQLLDADSIHSAVHDTRSLDLALVPWPSSLQSAHPGLPHSLPEFVREAAP